MAEAAAAEAWTPRRGGGQVIVKYQEMRSSRAFAADGGRIDLPSERLDRAASVFAEYGLTERFAARFKGELQSGRDAFVDYQGRGPVEIGLAWQAYRDDHTAVSLIGSVADGGEGRNAGYALPGQGERDWEVRAAIGRSLGPRRFWRDGAFVEFQAARRMRQGLPDETRLDATLGGRVGRDWLVMGQAFGGAADGGARWLSLEASVVRDLGPWSVQAGWRRAVWGRDTPESSGPVVAVWRRF